MSSQPLSQPQPKPRRKHWTRKKRIAVLMVLLILLAPFAAAGYYVWDITRAIEGAQDDAVFDFPTSDYELGGVSLSTPSTDISATPESNTVDIEGPKNSSRDNPGTISIARDLLSTGTRSDTVEPQDVWPGRDYINVLVLGVDTRDVEGDQNADVIMIARMDFVTNSVRVVSIPRDLQVEVPDHGVSKINGAYNIGVKEDPDNEVAGVLMMRDTIQYNFGVHIDEFVLVDFDGFEDVIDAVGGVTVNVPERIEDDAYPTEDFGTTTLIIEAGRQQMNGETALAYARTRHQDSDDGRRDRQMLVLRALLDKAQSLGSVTRISQVITAGGDAVMTSIDWDEQLALINIGLKLDQNQIEMTNIAEPLVTPGTSVDGAWIYVGDPLEIGGFIEDTLAGTD